MFVSKDGQIQQYFETEVLRTDRYDYSGFSVFDHSIQPNSLHREYCQRLVEKLDYTGLGCVQFIRNSDTGDSYFLELNPRVDARISLAVHCGVDLPGATVKVHAGEYCRSDSNYEIDQYGHWLFGDLTGLIRAWRRGEIGARQSLLWFASALVDEIRADCHTTFSWRDPKPTLKLYLSPVLRLLGATR